MAGGVNNFDVTEMQALHVQYSMYIHFIVYDT
jgi:hypothetical protein